MPRHRPRAIVCRQAVELVTDYLEDALSEEDRSRFEVHLAACSHCTRYLEQMRTTIALVGRVDPEGVDAETMDDLVALYRRWHSG